MGLGKWLMGAFGWAMFGPIGGIIAFLIGSGLENTRVFVSGSSTGDGSFNSYSGTEQRNSFMISLLVLSAAVMKADGKVMRSELDYVKKFLRDNFGEEGAANALNVLKELLQKDYELSEVCIQIRQFTNISQRLQLFHYLAGIAKADGVVSNAELDVLKRISQFMGISDADADSVLGMFGTSIEDAYKVLEITPEATDDEVRKAYRKMAMKHHPDKVESLGEDVRKAAEEKFNKIHEAYDQIKKERGIQ